MSNQKVTLKDIYLGYPYKYYDHLSNTIPNPYFPKHEISDHKYKISYKEWKKVVLEYFNILLEYLLTGKNFEIPNQLGLFRLMKYKPLKRKVDFKRTKEIYGEENKSLPKGEKKLIYHMNHHTNGYDPILVWERRDYKFPFKWHWRFDLSRKNFKKVSDILKKDLTVINKLHQK